ncbi:hypothetical protein K1T71_009611 [Dendrolimus kikuchii]|uniref:Uncharacterized protein n=1 Tax=Dendrolimus kikuchii TaxID=765133 RepID=A0ACC1CS68_9NEOP|nr:hypothetical protein K1T71_009611 [Dendrolimus kikuchii]
MVEWCPVVVPLSKSRVVMEYVIDTPRAAIIGRYVCAPVFDLQPMVYILTKERQLSLYSRRTDWESFREIVTKELSLQVALKTEGDIEEATKHFTTIVQSACWNSTAHNFLGTTTTVQPGHVKTYRRNITWRNNLIEPFIYNQGTFMPVSLIVLKFAECPFRLFCNAHLNWIPDTLSIDLPFLNKILTEVLQLLNL